MKAGSARDLHADHISALASKKGSDLEPSPVLGPRGGGGGERGTERERGGARGGGGGGDARRGDGWGDRDREWDRFGDRCVRVYVFECL